MQTQVKLLYAIQQIDTNVKNSEALQKKYDLEIQRVQTEVAAAQQRSTDAALHLEETEKRHRELERELQTQEEQKRKTADKLLSIKTNREYQSALQEIETIEAAIGKKEDAILHSLDEIEATRRSREEAKRVLEEARARFDERKHCIQCDVQAFLDDIEKQKQRRTELVDQVRADIFEDYLRIQRARNGVAVALADNEQCLGCSMHIPPQVYNEAVLGDKLISCPNCHRILFVEREPQETENRA